MKPVIHNTFDLQDYYNNASIRNRLDSIQSINFDTEQSTKQSAEQSTEQSEDFESFTLRPCELILYREAVHKYSTNQKVRTGTKRLITRISFIETRLKDHETNPLPDMLYDRYVIEYLWLQGLVTERSLNV